MRPDPSPDSPADEHPGFSPASRPDENLREQLSRPGPRPPRGRAPPWPVVGADAGCRPLLPLRPRPHRWAPPAPTTWCA